MLYMMASKIPPHLHVILPFYAVEYKYLSMLSRQKIALSKTASIEMLAILVCGGILGVVLCRQIQYIKKL